MTTAAGGREGRRLYQMPARMPYVNEGDIDRILDVYKQGKHTVGQVADMFDIAATECSRVLVAYMPVKKRKAIQSAVLSKLRKGKVMARGNRRNDSTKLPPLELPNVRGPRADPTPEQVAAGARMIRERHMKQMRQTPNTAVKVVENVVWES